MQLENSFTVPVPVDEAWRVLLDIERIAPCMPGAALDSVTGDDFTGRVKVKLGPINLTYQGKASFIEKDEAAHKAVIDARGKDQRGNGTAAATVTARLKAEGSITRVDVLTDLNITGRPAQFGRGVMTDVGNKLLGQFADKLAAQLGEGDAQGDAARAESTPSKAAATAAGAVEEVAASAEQAAGDGTPAKKAAAATKKAAAAAADSVATTSPIDVPAKKTGAAEAAPEQAAPAKADETRPMKAVPAPADTAPAAAETAPAAQDTAPKAPSGPPGGTTAPPRKAATGSPVRSVPSDGPREMPRQEPEPIDLLEVAGGAAMARYAAPAAGVFGLLLLIFLLVRRRR
ncbi:MAG TPA: SRPBCC family protein [Blastococcus sp.]|nr:SRPBCC family protein [Blastococcus sp.]